jgi:methionyl-tRNA formyltransferase/outer membrane protein assembly factor BamB/orotate phosphoribosyltransferase
MLQVVFFGSGSYSLTVIKFLHAQGFTPVAVVTDNGSLVHTWCVKRSIPVLTPKNLDSSQLERDLSHYEADVFVVAGFRKLPKRIFSIPPRHTLNLHPSLLPTFRGRMPIEAQILDNNTKLGVTIHVIDEQYDHGPIVQQTLYTPPVWPLSALRLDYELAYLGAVELVRILPDYCKDKLSPQTQNEQYATSAPLVAESQYHLFVATNHQSLWRSFCALGWNGQTYMKQDQDSDIAIYITAAYMRNDVFVIKTIRYKGQILTYEEFLDTRQLTNEDQWTQFSALHNPQVANSNVDAGSSDPTLRLREAIHQSVIISSKDATIVNPNGSFSENWLLDFRAIFLQPAHLRSIAEIFWQQYKDQYPFQVGGQETAAIPLVTAIILYGQEIGLPVNGFFIRKERKTSGLQKIIEGELTQNKAILVDDLINSGGTQLRQVEILEAEGIQVSDIFVLCRFRATRHYRFASEKNIRVNAPFTPFELGLSFSQVAATLPTETNFRIEWTYTAPTANLFHVVPKSRPVLHDTLVLFGADDGIFRALDQVTGDVVWQHHIWPTYSLKTIFSSPVVHAQTVYYGAYDGNVYALDATTGAKKWVFKEADWVGSSPCIAADYNLLFVGLEFGLFKSRGGIVALDAITGKKRWEYSMPGLTHGSPAYSSHYRAVGIGCNDANFYLFNAKTGTLQWQHQTGGEIKYAPVFDERYTRVLFGSHDGILYAHNIKTGAHEGSFRTGGEIYSTPCLHDDAIYVSSMDKHLYCLDRETLTERWRIQTSGKIMSSPVVINDRVYIGSNDGVLYEVDKNGAHTGFIHAGERIVNNIVYNKQSDVYFLWTHANQLHKLTRIDNTT